VTVVVVFLGLLRTPAVDQQVDLTLESAAATSAGAFTPDFRTGGAAPSGAAATSSLPAGVVDTGAVSGSTEGIYRAGKGTSPCDRDGLGTFFKSNPSISDLWVRAAAGDPVLMATEAFKTVTASALPAYVATLTPVFLRADTQVTAFSMAAAAFAPRQSVLQAGTAVLVDERGLPRLRCAGGSPLTSPARNAPTARRAGEPWPGFVLRATVVMTPAANPLRQFGLTPVTGETIFRRPAGSTGPQDIDQSQQTALLDGVYAVQGPQVTCEGLKTCSSNNPLSITIQLRNCSADQCTISAPKNYWIGDFPFSATNGRWSGTGPTGVEKGNTCNGVRNPATFLDLSLAPGDFVIDANGIWRANSLTGTSDRCRHSFVLIRKNRTRTPAPDGSLCIRGCTNTTFSR